MRSRQACSPGRTSPTSTLAESSTVVEAAAGLDAELPQAARPAARAAARSRAVPPPSPQDSFKNFLDSSVFSPIPVPAKTIPRFYTRSCRSKGLTNRALCAYNRSCRAGVVQRPVHQPSKLRTRVRLPSPAPQRARCIAKIERAFFAEPPFPAPYLFDRNRVARTHRRTPQFLHRSAAHRTAGRSAGKCLRSRGFYGIITMPCCITWMGGTRFLPNFKYWS